MSATIHEAARQTGWSPRMLRYLEERGLLSPARTASGYRVYRAGDLDSLRSLRALLDRHELEVAEVSFALRLRREPALRSALDAWLATSPAGDRATATQPTQTQPAQPPAEDHVSWLEFEQDKHLRLVPPVDPTPTRN